MTPSDRIALPLLGVAFWIAGTVFYEFRGHQVFEGGAPRYWVNFILTTAITTVVCILILKVRHIPPIDWAAAGLLIALPGMFGEAILLSRFAEWMPRMHPESAGRYGSFLFATYAVFLTIAEVVALRAAK